MRVRSPWIWVTWLLLIAVSFAVLEGLALADRGGLSFSQFFVSIRYAWPPISCLVGIAIGILICHFEWVWVPKQNRETCPQCGYERLKNRHGG